MTELVGFQTMVILDPNGMMTFDAVGAFGLVFKSGSSYCGRTIGGIEIWPFLSYGVDVQ